jgi:hypothetical protein
VTLGGVLRRALAAAMVLGGVAALVGAWRIDADWYEVHALRLRCAVDPSELAGVGRLRATLAVAGILALAAVVPLGRLLRRVSRGAALRVGAAVVLALVVSDLIARRKAGGDAAPVEPTPIALPPAHDDPRLRWALDGPRTTTFVEDGRPVPYAVDAYGDRVQDEADVPDPDRPTILFAGESMTFGLGVLWDETYPALVGRALGVQVVDAGVHGYADDQIYLRMLDRLAGLRHPLAVVTLTMPDLLDRDVSATRNRLGVAADGALFVVHERPALVRESPLFALVDRLSLSRDDESLRVARALLTAGDRAVRARGARSLVLFTNYGRPCLRDASGRPSLEGRLFDGLPLEHVRVDLEPDAMVESSHHPNPSGHLRLAQAVIAWLGRSSPSP